MNDPFRTAFETYERNGADFHAALAHCLAVGEVQSNADFFCMGWPEGDAFFVQMLAGDFKSCARFNAGRFQSLRFHRNFKGDARIHQINLERLNRHG